MCEKESEKEKKALLSQRTNSARLTMVRRNPNDREREVAAGEQREREGETKRP